MQDVQVGSIRVRAQDLTPDQGQALGDQIALLLAERLAGGAAQRDVGHVQVRLQVQGGESVEELARQVVEAVVGAL